MPKPWFLGISFSASVRVVDTRADLAADEVGDRGVGLRHDHEVAEVAHPDAEAGLCVELLVEGLAHLGADGEGVALVRLVDETAPRLLAASEDLGVGRPDSLHLLAVDRPVSQWRAEVRCALEDRERAGCLGDLGDGLDAGGAGADDSDALALERHGLVRPAGGVIRLALEAVDARDVGHRGGGQRADGGDQELGAGAATVVDRELPLVLRLIPGRGEDPAVECDVAAEVELVGDEVAVAEGLRLSREVLAPLPLLEDLVVEGVAVRPALRVEARAGVAVPVPGAADIAASLEDTYGEAERAQAVELVHPGDAGADDDGVVVLWRRNDLRGLVGCGRGHTCIGSFRKARRPVKARER